jgi:hypothetical protein
MTLCQELMFPAAVALPNSKFNLAPPMAYQVAQRDAPSLSECHRQFPSVA